VTGIISKVCWIAGAMLLLAIPGALGLKQRKDMAAVQKYIARIQPQLASDSRFKDVHLLGYSCSHIMHPYIPVTGTVPTQQDWEALRIFFRDSGPPVFMSVKSVSIGPTQKPPRLH
jgi:hypothetical protein